jgi:hypothetical protein
MDIKYEESNKSSPAYGLFASPSMILCENANQRDSCKIYLKLNLHNLRELASKNSEIKSALSETRSSNSQPTGIVKNQSSWMQWGHFIHPSFPQHNSIQIPLVVLLCFSLFFLKKISPEARLMKYKLDQAARKYPLSTSEPYLAQMQKLFHQLNRDTLYPIQQKNEENRNLLKDVHKMLLDQNHIFESMECKLKANECKLELIECKLKSMEDDLMPVLCTSKSRNVIPSSGPTVDLPDSPPCYAGDSDNDKIINPSNLNNNLVIDAVKTKNYSLIASHPHDFLSETNESRQGLVGFTKFRIDGNSSNHKLCARSEFIAIHQSDRILLIPNIVEGSDEPERLLKRVAGHNRIYLKPEGSSGCEIQEFALVEPNSHDKSYKLISKGKLG